MRLSDRLFAFRRSPARSDAVQVLLWITGWAVVVAFVAFLADTLSTYATVFRRGGFPESTAFLVTVLIISVLSTLVWILLACWFVSEAYRGWRAGHRHGRQWTLLISILMLVSGVLALVMGGSDLAPLPLGLLAADSALGLALLISCLTTKPPEPAPQPTVEG